MSLLGPYGPEHDPKGVVAAVLIAVMVSPGVLLAIMVAAAIGSVVKGWF